jgi:hypothetical protein
MEQLFAQLPISHFFTLTFGSIRVGRALNASEYRERMLKQWICTLEGTPRKAVGYFYAVEHNNYSGLGFPGSSPHLHGCLVGGYHVDRVCAEASWKTLAGDGLVLPFIPEMGAVEYCFKKALVIDDWNLGNLEGFL